MVFVEPAFEKGDGGGEVVAFGEEQVDGVEVFLAGEAVGESPTRTIGQCVRGSLAAMTYPMPYTPTIIPTHCQISG